MTPERIANLRAHVARLERQLEQARYHLAAAEQGIQTWPLLVVPALPVADEPGTCPSWRDDDGELHTCTRRDQHIQHSDGRASWPRRPK